MAGRAAGVPALSATALASTSRDLVGGVVVGRTVMMRRCDLLLWMVLCAAVGHWGCADAADPGEDGGNVAPDCVPEQGEWESRVAQEVASRCGSCHGEAPDYGAPIPLVDYEALITGEPGARPRVAGYSRRRPPGRRCR